MCVFHQSACFDASHNYHTRSLRLCITSIFIQAKEKKSSSQPSCVYSWGFLIFQWREYYAIVNRDRTDCSKISVVLVLRSSGCGYIILFLTTELILVLVQKVLDRLALVADNLLQIARDKAGLALLDKLELIQQQVDHRFIGDHVVVVVMVVMVLFMATSGNKGLQRDDPETPIDVEQLRPVFALLERLKVLLEFFTRDLLELDALTSLLTDGLDETLGGDLVGTGESVLLVLVYTSKGGVVVICRILVLGSLVVVMAVFNNDGFDRTAQVTGIERRHMTLGGAGHGELPLLLDDGAPEEEALIEDALAEDQVAGAVLFDHLLDLVEGHDFLQVVIRIPGTCDRHEQASLDLLLLHGTEEVLGVLDTVLGHLGDQDGTADTRDSFLKRLFVVVVDLMDVDVLELLELVEVGVSVVFAGQSDDLDFGALLLELLGQVDGNAVAEP